MAPFPNIFFYRKYIYDSFFES